MLKSRTATGSFPIGLRPKGGEWITSVAGAIGFAVENRFAGIDLGQASAEEVRAVQRAGLAVGSIDLRQPWTDLASPDSGKRNAAADRNGEFVEGMLEFGIRRFFGVVIPEDSGAERSVSFGHAVEGFGRLAARVEAAGAKIVLEGWPGRWPHFSSLVCTPADSRAFFKAIGSDAIGINYDPSHLVRMGIDPYRFLSEFIDRVHHVHAKDVAFLFEGLYEHGNLQPATFEPPHTYGGHCWRYTIPGNGVIRWTDVLRRLTESRYDGSISIELEDEEFHGTPEAEARGLLLARDFLESA